MVNYQRTKRVSRRRPYKSTYKRNTRGRRLQPLIVPRNPNNIERAVNIAGVNAGAAIIRHAARQASQYVRRRVVRPPVQKASRLPISMGEYGGVDKKVVVLYKNSRPIDRRTLKLGFNHRVMRFQRCNTMNAGTSIPGSIWLHHGTFNTNETLTPCYFMCLNHTNNQSTLTAGPMYQLRFTDTGAATFGFIQAQDPGGTLTQAKWIVDYTSPSFNSGANDPEIRYIMNAWYDIRLNCYGANAQPTEYDIMVVSFKDSYLDPLELPTSSQEVSDRHALYQAFVQKYMTNPILPVKLPTKKYFVHARHRFLLQSTLNVENDQTPSNKIVKMFIRDGSLYDYAYHGDGFTGATADDKLSTTQFTVQGASGPNDYSDFPAPKARKWLVIRALNTTRIASGSETRADTPSFDIVVRKGEYCQAR